MSNNDIIQYIQYTYGNNSQNRFENNKKGDVMEANLLAILCSIIQYHLSSHMSWHMMEIVADEDIEDVKNWGLQMGLVQESIATRRTKRNSLKLALLTSDMIIAYALSIIEKSIPSTYREGEISSASEM